MSLIKVDDNSKSQIYEFINENEFKVTRQELVLDRDKVLTTDIVLEMWRYFRNTDPIGQSLGNLPPMPQVSTQELTKFKSFYTDFVPFFIDLIQSQQDSYIQILSNFRNQPYIRIIKIDSRIYTLKLPFSREAYDKISDQFLKSSNRLGYFGHMLVILLNTQLESSSKC